MRCLILKKEGNNNSVRSKFRVLNMNRVKRQPIKKGGKIANYLTDKELTSRIQTDVVKTQQQKTEPPDSKVDEGLEQTFTQE